MLLLRSSMAKTHAAAGSRRTVDHPFLGLVSGGQDTAPLPSLWQLPWVTRSARIEQITRR